MFPPDVSLVRHSGSSMAAREIVWKRSREQGRSHAVDENAAG
jgi:hypothetical protein